MGMTLAELNEETPKSDVKDCCALVPRGTQSPQQQGDMIRTREDIDQQIIEMAKRRYREATADNVVPFARNSRPSRFGRHIMLVEDELTGKVSYMSVDVDGHLGYVGED